MSADTIHRAVVMAKLMYASVASWSFTAATDRHRLEAVFRREIRSGLCSTSQLSLSELVEDADDDLFIQVLRTDNRVPNVLLPAKIESTYNITDHLWLKSTLV